MAAVFEFGKVALCVFRPEGMVTATQGQLPVAEHGIDPVELRLRHRDSSTPADHNRMPASGLSDAVEAFQAVGNHLATRHQVSTGPVGEVRLAETRDHVPFDALGVTLFGGLHGRYEWGLAVRSTTPVAAASLAAQIGVIQLHSTFQTLASGPLDHHLHQLVLDVPGGMVGDSQLAVQLHCRAPLLGLGPQVGRLEPEGQRQLAGLEEGTGEDRGLPTASTARAQFPGVPVATLVVAAVRAHEAVGPAQPEQGIVTFSLVSVLLKKCVGTETSLERDRIALPRILL